jgi:peptidylprolyl isomerase
MSLSAPVLKYFQHQHLLFITQIIESSWSGQPATFPLAQVVEGWQKGLPGAKVGGRRLLILPPAMGYGAAGAGPIGPNETLIFSVDIIGVA